MNLVINARDAMPQGGQIAIDAANTQGPALPRGSDKDELGPGNYVRLTVSDSGCGIPAHVLGRVFEPFFTTKPLGGGTGLGLSMVYGFAKQSGGHVTIASEPGHGAMVALYFPAEPDAACTRAPVDAASEWRAGARTALLVEDQEPVLKVVERMLAGLGFTVTAARTAQEALNLLGQPTPFDLLLTDVVLPGPTDGVSLAARAAEWHPATKVLLTSGYTDHAVNGKLARSNDVELLTKPFRRRDLSDRLRQIFDGVPAR
jgi:CheY-like chemotaxis protein